MIFEEILPSDSLKPYLLNVIYNKGFQADYDKDKFLPDGTTNLIFDLTDTPKYIYHNDSLEIIQTCHEVWFSGMQTRYITISSGVDAEMIVVTFNASGVYPFLEKPLGVFQDRVVDGWEVFGDQILEVREQMIAAKNWNTKVKILMNWLENILQNEEFAYTVIRTQLNRLREERQSIQLQRLAEQSGYSQKQFIHLFKKYVGLTPKQYHRILRFNDILTAIYGKEKVDGAGLAVECGYFDQSHFIKDFLAFSGLNPADYSEQQGDWLHYIPMR